MKNVVAAFAVAPLASALLAAVVAFLFAMASGGADVMGSVAGTIFVVTAAVGYAAAVVLGIPGYLLFRRLGWVRASHWVLLCSSVGVATGAIAPASQLLVAGSTDAIWMVFGEFLAAGALLGAAAGLLFARTIRIKSPGVHEIAATFD